jgi:hypothetical protein
MDLMISVGGANRTIRAGRTMSGYRRRPEVVGGGRKRRE